MRLAKAKEELGYAHLFDTILVNDDLTIACAAAKQLIEQFING
jgi:guanylate kinase